MQSFDGGRAEGMLHDTGQFSTLFFVRSDAHRIKLSRRFYERFGEELANELVELINVVDDRYRLDVHEVNERNFSRFDARLEQRLAETRSDLRQEISSLGASLRSEIAELRESLRSDIAILGAGTDRKITDAVSGLEVRIHRDMATQTRWLVGLWAVQMTAFVGTVLAILQNR